MCAYVIPVYVTFKTAGDVPRDFMPQIKRACRDYFKAGLGLA